MFPFKPNKKYTLIALYTGATIAIAILFGVIIFNLGSIGKVLSDLLSVLTPLIYGLMIAYLTRPLVSRFERLYAKLLCKNTDLSEKKLQRRDMLKRSLSIFTSFLFLGAFIFCFAVFVFPLLLGDTKMLGERLAQLAEKVVSLVNYFGPAFGFHLTVENLLAFLQSSRTAIMDYVTSFGASLATTLFDLFVGLCLSVGILYHRRTLAAAARRILAALFSLRVFRYLERLAFYSNRIFGRYLIGKIVECSIVGLIYLIVLPILGVPYPFLITIVMTITNFIPISQLCSRLLID